MVRKLVLAVAAASALMSSNMAHALGVGDINLRSALNQPLDAEIELLQVRDLSSAEIRPALASPDDFGRAGIDRDFFLTDLKFTPEVRPDGRAVIRVTSNKPVREPFLNFLMEVKWPAGRVLREFTLLLDPPLYQPAPLAAQPAPAASRTPSSSAARQYSEVTPPRSSATPTQSGASNASAAGKASGGGGQVRANSADTLWEIAQRNRPQGASVHQTMLAIQDLNPNAFLDGNINRMLSGSTLTMPDAEQANARSQAEAITQVAEQNAAWQRGRQVAQPAQRQLDARERDTAAAAPATTDGGDSLRLLAGTGEGGSGESQTEGSNSEAEQLRDSLDRTKEQLDSAEREKAEMADRLQDVQGQLDTLQRLLALKDAQLAALQDQLTADDTAEGQSAVDVAQAPALDAEAAESVAQAQAEAIEATDPVEDPAAESIAQEPAANGQTEQLVESAASDSRIVPAVANTAEVAEAEPAEELAPVVQPTANNRMAEQSSAERDDGVESMLERLLQNQTLMLVAGAAALLILLLILMALARRNARREEAMSGSFIAPIPSSAAQEPLSNDFNVALASFDETDNEQSIAQDPLTEADALVAYGQHEKAAEVLRAAIANDPDRAELRLKLMEVEALLNNPQGYAAQAETLRNMGGHDPQIEALNLRFPAMAAALLGASSVLAEDPEAERFDAFDDADDGVVASAAETSEQDFDFSDFDLGEDMVEPIEAEPEQTQPEPEQTQPEPEQTQPAVEEAEFDLDFDLEDTLAEQSQPQTLEQGYPASNAIVPAGSDSPATSHEDAAFDASEFDLEFNLDDETVTAADQPSQAPLDESLEASLDDDYDLSLTEDMQAEQLLAEFEAMQEESGGVEEQAPREEASVEDFNLSDEDLAGFEDELSASIEAESAQPSSTADTVAHSDTVHEEHSTELPDALDPFTADLPTDQAMSESMEDEFDFLSGTDECATKLDLARAYIDMGDEEGARDILAEVVEEGNDQQQQDARDMLAQLD